MVGPGTEYTLVYSCEWMYIKAWNQKCPWEQNSEPKSLICKEKKILWEEDGRCVEACVLWAFLLPLSSKPPSARTCDVFNFCSQWGEASPARLSTIGWSCSTGLWLPVRSQLCQGPGGSFCLPLLLLPLLSLLRSWQMLVTSWVYL